ncbi:MAG: DUF1963 domain-containing protein, partial [Treponema sp.]|nr:DUF1963 domain-containing protein [Treponema sp.]
MERLSLKKALKNDYTMTVSLCCILIGGILFFLHDKFGLVISKREIKTDGSIVYSIIPGAIALFGILNAFRRWLRIRGIFERGVTVPATVTNSSFFKDRGRISYRYAYEGSEYRTGLALCRNKVTEAIGGGEKVFVIVDERKPKRSLILSLYSDNEEKPPSSLYTGGQAEQLVAELRRRTALPSLAIHARLADEPLSLTTSKFGGLPYWNPAEAYPVGVDGRKLIMLAQLNMADIPPLEGFPSTGLLQFFIGGGDG